jgi:hypothetical protein
MKTNYRFGMLFRVIAPFLLVIFFMKSLKAQDPAIETRTLHVMARDKETKEEIAFANVVLYSLDMEQLQVGTTNMDGEAELLVPALPAHIIKGVFVGYRVAIDTLYYNDTTDKTIILELESGGVIICGMSCCYGDLAEEEFDSQEEVFEAERMIERAEKEGDIREDLNEFVCYPNPVYDVLKISIDGIYATELLLMNETGQVLIKRAVTHEDYEFECDIRHYPAGCYYVVCRGEGLSSNTSTIIKRDQ